MRPLDPDRAARLIELLKDENLSRGEIARRVPCGVATVTRWGLKHGRTFDRSAAAAAIAVRVLDGRAKRTALADGLVEDAQQERTTRATYDEPRDRTDSARSIAALVKSVVDLDRVELDRQAADVAASLTSASDLDGWLAAKVQSGQASASITVPLDPGFTFTTGEADG